jgi:superfamily II DNA helicase RecQ
MMDTHGDSHHQTLSRASVLDGMANQFLETIFHKHDIVGSFPLEYATLPLYLLPAQRLQTTALVVVPDRQGVRNLTEELQRKGVGYPEVVALDGSQVPHEERDILNAVQQKRVRVVYTTPETFATQKIQHLFLHGWVGFLVVLQGQFCLDGFSGSFRYAKLPELLTRMRKRPPTVVLTPPLPEVLTLALCETLSLQAVESFNHPPILSKAHLSVQHVLNPNQKLKALYRRMNDELSSSRRQAPPPSRLIIAAEPRDVDKLFSLLSRSHPEGLYALHPGLSWGEYKTIDRVFSHQPGATLITTSYGAYNLTLNPGFALDVIFWQPVHSLYEVFWHCYRSVSREQQPIDALILYNREDYQALLYRIRAGKHLPPAILHSDQYNADAMIEQQVKHLKMFRRWVLSKPCRNQSMTAYGLGESARDVFPCGHCDRCQAHPFRRFSEQILQYWLY